jgi:hypothetical protein
MFPARLFTGRQNGAFLPPVHRLADFRRMVLDRPFREQLPAELAAEDAVMA